MNVSDGTAQGIREAAGSLGFDTPSDFVRAYPVSREWLALLVRRMDAVARLTRCEAVEAVHALGQRVMRRVESILDG